MQLSCHRRRRWTVLTGILGHLLCFSAGHAQVQFEIRGAIVPWNLVPGSYSTDPELTPAQIEAIPGTVQTRLEQAEALGAAGEWEEAIDTLLSIMAEPVAGLVEVSPDRFITLRQYGHQRIARLPQPALALYRARVDATAEVWYQDGIERRDRSRLVRVVEEMFCSSWGDDAQMALGEMALEAGDYPAARWHWESISPLLRSPAGRPAWFALAGIDRESQWPAVARAWQERATAPDWLAYPDTDLDLAEVRARLVLVSIREGNLSRAQLELELLERWHPEAQGQLAGREQAFAAALGSMIEGARTWPEPPDSPDWPTVGGNPSRDGRSGKLPLLAGPIWEKPVSFIPTTTTVRHTPAIDSAAPAAVSHLPLRYHPVVVDGRVLFCGSRHLQAVELTTGKPAITDDGILFRSAATGGQPRIPRPSTIHPIGADGVEETAHYTLSSHEGVVYARMGSPVTAPAIQPRAFGTDSSDQEIAGLDLSRDALLTFKAKPDDGAWAFEGAPLCDASSLYVAVRQNDVKQRAHVACFDLATGKLRWRTPLCAADTPTSALRDEISNGLLTLVGNTIYYNTNLGVIAALETTDGSIRWLRRYDRATESSTDRFSGHHRRALAPCVYHNGVVMVAPTDTPLVFALDAATGKTLWVCEHAGDTTDLLGIADGNLIATGDRCRAIDVRTGDLKFVWPQAQQSGIVGCGRGCLAGGEVFWPTHRHIYVLDAATGAQTRPPIDISAFSEDGANLVPASEVLLVAGSDRLIALGSASIRTPSSSDEQLSFAPGSYRQDSLSPHVVGATDFSYP